jgi:hypothetical protein
MFALQSALLGTDGGHLHLGRSGPRDRCALLKNFGQPQKEVTVAGYYLHVEALNQNDFIFDTDDLSTRRGGSLMLLNAIGEVTKSLKRKWPVTTAPGSTEETAQVTVIQEGASVGLYRLDLGDDIDEKAVVKVAQEALPAFVKDATFGVACIRASGSTPEAFQKDRQEILAHIRWDQMQILSLRVPLWNTKTAIVLLNGHGMDVGPCEMDKVRPCAQEIPKGPDPKDIKKVSQAVYDKHNYGKSEKQGKKERPGFYQKEIEGTGYSLPQNQPFVNDLEDLTEDPIKGIPENLNHKMAIIHIDGNGFGQQFDGVAAGKVGGKTPWERYGEASRKLKDYRRAMLVTLMQRMAGDDGWKNKKENDAYRIETLLWGGDEITWVVPAWKGWETLQLFYQQAKAWEIIAGRPVTHAAGLVFCNHKAPIQRMIKLAEDLCHAAKDADPGKSKNLVSFQVLESFDFMCGDLEGFREALIPGHENELVLAGDAMDKVPEAFAKLKAAIPRKQVYKAAQQAHEETLPYRKNEDGTDKTDSLGQRICVLTDEAERAGADIPPLKACFGSIDEVFWYHARELWDYIPQGQPQPRPGNASAAEGGQS